MMIPFLFKHITRSPKKSLLGMAVSLSFVLALGVLQSNIRNTWAEIDRLYAETAVNVEIRLSEDFRATRRPAGDIVPSAVLRDIEAMGIMQDVHLEASAAVMIAASLGQLTNVGGMDLLVGVDELRQLTEEPHGFLSREASFDMAVQFAPGHDEDSFVHAETVPMIVSQELAERRGIHPGDNAYIAFYVQPRFYRPGEWHYISARVIGSHDGEALPAILRQAAIIPMASMQHIFGEAIAYYSVKFTIDPAHNYALLEISERLEFYARPRYPWREPLMADIWDQELRFGAASLRQHVMLLEMLFPVALFLSAVIGAGLATLLSLQNAKIAAIMRVMGASKQKVLLTLWLWQVIISGLGIITGAALTNALALTPYIFIGIMAGAAIGAVLVTSRAPLELLQVKE